MQPLCTYVQNQVAVHNWDGDRLFNLTFKHHQLLHCAERSRYVSPRVTWSFMGEHFMNAQGGRNI